LHKIVYAIDDDRGVRMMLSSLLEDWGIAVRPFAGGGDFLAELAHLTPGCILLDLRMPKIDGMEVLRELVARGIAWPVIVITAHGGVAEAVEAMRLGALNFIEKPFDNDALEHALHEGFESLQQLLIATEARDAALVKLALLTGREREVLDLALTGKSNREISLELGVSPRTTEMHRSNLLRKLGAQKLSEVLHTLASAQSEEPQLRRSQQAYVPRRGSELN
jgi:two-component system response regulator FixJ